MASAKASTFATIHLHAQRIAAAGHRSIMFAVSELTIRPDFLRIVRACRALGFTTIAVVTNGRRFAYADFAKAAVDSGATHFLVSVHGADAKTHQALTRTPDSFAQTCAGFRNLLACGARVMSNTVVSRRNVDQLPAVISLVHELGGRLACLSLLQLVGAALKHADSLSLTMSDALPAYRAALEVGRRLGVTVGVGGMPPCVLPEDPWAFGVDDLTEIHADRPDAQITERSPYTHAPPCARCAMLPVCPGPQEEYLRRYGHAELVPFAGPLFAVRPPSRLAAEMFGDCHI
jgi:hypothetical protein